MTTPLSLSILIIYKIFTIKTLLHLGRTITPLKPYLFKMRIVSLMEARTIKVKMKNAKKLITNRDWHNNLTEIKHPKVTGILHTTMMIILRMTKIHLEKMSLVKVVAFKLIAIKDLTQIKMIMKEKILTWWMLMIMIFKMKKRKTWMLTFQMRRIKIHLEKAYQTCNIKIKSWSYLLRLWELHKEE